MTSARAETIIIIDGEKERQRDRLTLPNGYRKLIPITACVFAAILDLSDLKARTDKNEVPLRRRKEVRIMFMAFFFRFP